MDQTSAVGTAGQESIHMHINCMLLLVIQRDNYKFSVKNDRAMKTFYCSPTTNTSIPDNVSVSQGKWLYLVI